VSLSSLSRRTALGGWRGEGAPLRIFVVVVRVAAATWGFHVETLIIYKLGFKQNYYTFALILLIKIVLCSEFY